VDIEYLANNRIDRARDSNDGFVWRNYTHDIRGNVTDNDRLDQALNEVRPRSATDTRHRSR